MLTLSGISKSFGDHVALTDVDLEIAPGEIVGLLGPNGAGKTTLSSIVAGLLRPDRGHVEVAGIDVARHPERARLKIGLAPQELGIYQLVTVEENLVYFAQLAGLDGPSRRKAIEEIGEALELVPLLSRLAFTLSGGEKRRLHVAMALLHRAPLVILDEPTVGADVRMRKNLLDLVLRRAEEGVAVLYATHYMPEVEALDAGVCILDRGLVLARGGLRTVIEAHSETVVELTFDGPAPALELSLVTEVRGNVIRIRTSEGASAAADALRALGSATDRLEGVEILRPSLESAYLAVTGHRFQESADGADNRLDEELAS